MQTKEILKLINGNAGKALLKFAEKQAVSDPKIGKLQEIRLQVGKAVLIRYAGKEYGVRADGEITRQPDSGTAIDAFEMRSTIDRLAGYSLYVYDDELRQGYFTIRGGHRIGIAGKAVTDNGRITTIYPISSCNLRFASQVPGCAEQLLSLLRIKDSWADTLILSPPGGGKTTMLRDLIRLISNGSETIPGIRVAVVDERSEIGASWQGIVQNDLGLRTDVLDGCERSIGIPMMLRVLTPDLVAIDELGRSEDGKALEQAKCSGCSILATAHGKDLKEIDKYPMFERFVFLEGKEAPGHVTAVLDREGHTAAPYS